MRIDWRKEKIGNLCKVGRGSSPRPIKDQSYFEGGTIPWIKIADATKSGKYLYDTKAKVNDFGASFSRLLPVDSLIVAASGTLGYTQFLGVPGCVHDGWIYLHSYDENVDRNFLYYFFKWRQKYFSNMAYGAAIQNINTMIMREMEIYLPLLPTQQKIASILSAYDNLIENNTRRIQILEEMAQRIYKEWFVDFKYPGHENDKLVDSELGIIPSGWEVKEFGEKITFTRGKNITRKQMVHGEVPVVSAGINPSGFHNVSNVNGPVVTISASGANAGHISYYLRNIWVADCSYINNEMTPYIFYYFSLVKFYSREITNLQRGAAQPHVYPKDVARISIIDPKIETIKEFEKIVVNIFNEIGILRKEIFNLRQTRDLLLPKLISGKVDVSDLDIDTSIFHD